MLARTGMGLGFGWLLLGAAVLLLVVIVALRWTTIQAAARVWLPSLPGWARRLWARLAERAGISRVGYAILPSAEFDASAEELRRFAHLLAGARRGMWSRLSHRGAAFRIRLESTSDGAVSGAAPSLVYVLEGPTRAAEVLRRPGYGGVEVVDVDAPEIAALLGGQPPDLLQAAGPGGPVRPADPGRLDDPATWPEPVREWLAGDPHDQELGDPGRDSDVGDPGQHGDTERWEGR